MEPIDRKTMRATFTPFDRFRESLFFIYLNFVVLFRIVPHERATESYTNFCIKCAMRNPKHYDTWKKKYKEMKKAEKETKKQTDSSHKNK